jgi:hypothetical protein
MINGAYRAMTDVPWEEIEPRISAPRENVPELVEQAAAYSGAAGGMN